MVRAELFGLPAGPGPAIATAADSGPGVPGSTGRPSPIRVWRGVCLLGAAGPGTPSRRAASRGGDHRDKGRAGWVFGPRPGAADAAQLPGVVGLLVVTDISLSLSDW